MKTLLIVLALVLSVSAQAFDKKHMVEFNGDSVVLGSLSFDNSKTKGSNKDNSTNLGLSLNYAYALTSNLQVGAKGAWFDSAAGDDKVSDKSLLVGAIWNFDTDFRSAYYVSVYAGYDWTYSNSDSTKIARNEAVLGKASFGKRFPLHFISENLVYSPEVTFTSTTPTKSNSQEWGQDLSFKFIQFSAFF